jgi:hypothetical protein
MHGCEQTAVFAVCIFCCTFHNCRASLEYVFTSELTCEEITVTCEAFPAHFAFEYLVSCVHMNVACLGPQRATRSPCLAVHFEHISYFKGLLPVWIWKWITKLLCWLQHLLCTAHLKGLCPVWKSLCLCRLPAFWKHLLFFMSHMSNELFLNGCSPPPPLLI